MKISNYLVLSLLSMTLVSCGTFVTQPSQVCPAGIQNMPDCPPLGAVNDEAINKIYKIRTWVPPDKLTLDPIKTGNEAKVPINDASTKVLGPTYAAAVRSLAAKIWLIEHAQHTIDAMYYIFATDKVGYAVIGALCNAVQRGVDVRIMVDSLGSLRPVHNELRALETCADNAGFMRNAQGQVTTKKARVQAVIFNAITKSQFNRRAHDKLLIVDGAFPERAVVITGGRNISLDYYGINKDGTKDPKAFRDMEILIRSNPQAAMSVGQVSELYYSLLFLHKGNRRIRPYHDEEEDEFKFNDSNYAYQRKKAQESLAFLKAVPDIKKKLDDMPKFMSEGFRPAQVRLVHQLHNLTSLDVTSKVLENVESNPNSILYLLNKLTEQSIREGQLDTTFRIVSPYIFTGQYRDKEGKIIYDGAKVLHKLLKNNPKFKIIIITNSVMTSDNFFTQAIIDMEMAPRLLLSPELRKKWLEDTKESELNPALVESDAWRKAVNNPQIFIYETGKLDSDLLGGKTPYGKLHAKFILGKTVGFIGTSNFDYRSNLYNNELGFVFLSPGLSQDVLKIFEQLKSTAYRWGTPEWLKMRRELMAGNTEKSGKTRKQRFIYKSIRAFGLEYLM